jgi:hypothetical protein
LLIAKNDKELITPCGMNCSVCSACLAFTHDVKSQGVKMPYCQGCRPKNKQCAFLKKRCRLLSIGEVRYCYECPDFPCENLKGIDRRYRTNFRMSLIENLEHIRESGIPQFLESEMAKWRCSACGGVICCHNGICFSCGLEKLKNRKIKY